LENRKRPESITLLPATPQFLNQARMNPPPKVGMGSPNRTRVGQPPQVVTQPTIVSDDRIQQLRPSLPKPRQLSKAWAGDFVAIAAVGD
jgi:hypothetical protein